MSKEMKSIPGHPKYMVDSDGNVFSLMSGHLKKLKHCIQGDGYHSVYLYDSGDKRVKYYVHRLVVRYYSSNGMIPMMDLP
jgi:hypothetical protein